MTSDKHYLVRLDWPPACLSPNSRVHWTKKATAAKAYRYAARLTAQAMGCRALTAPRLTIEITFYPPDKRRRDTDNMMASIKSGLDGIADATGVDDSNWNYGIARGEPIKGGGVLVHVMPAGDDNWKSIGGIAAGMVGGKVE